MNCTIKEATVKIYFYETLEELKKHLFSWLMMYNFEKKLKSLQYNSSHDIMLKEFDENESNFNENPYHKNWVINT